MTMLQVEPTIWTPEGIVKAVEVVRQTTRAGCWGGCGQIIERDDNAVELVVEHGGRKLYHDDCFRRFGPPEIVRMWVRASDDQEARP